MAVKIVCGGSTGKSFHFGPGIWKKGYPTVANGWAQPIEAGPGEVIALISGGSPHAFARWARGKVHDVVTYLRTKAAETDDGPTSRRLYVLAAEIEAAAAPDSTPMGRLAHALDLDVSHLAEAVHLAKVSVSE